MTLKKRIKAILPDRLVDIIVSARLYYGKFGRFPSLIHPKTLNEKIIYRKLFDRRPILTTFADKYEVRKYVAEKIGEEYLPRLYFVTENPEEIPFDNLPNSYVIKPTHGSGWVKIVEDKNTIDPEEIIKLCHQWLGVNYYEWTREWQYKHIKPRIIIEEFISDNGNTPVDYKFFVFHGKTEFIRIDVGRFGNHRQNVYDCNWNKMDITCSYENIEGSVEKPKDFDQMLKLAEKLCEGMDFLRVDLYSTNKIYFGEITTTSGNGLSIFKPEKYDHIFGKIWKMDI